MSRKSWKASERRLATIIGGKRVPITGRSRGSAPDIEGVSWLSIEVKSRKVVPLWLLTGIEQAEAAVRGDQLPIVLVHRDGDRYQEALVVLRLKDFTEWFGEESVDAA